MYLYKNIQYLFFKAPNQSISKLTKFPKIERQIRSLNDVKKKCNKTITLSTLQEKSKHGRVKCTLIPGDGIGPELVRCVKDVFAALKIPIDFEAFFFSELNEKVSASLEEVIKSIRKNKVCLMGVLASPAREHGELLTLNIRMRRKLGLFAKMVFIQTLPNVRSRYSGVDIILIREQTEGEYSALEHEAVPGIVESLKISTVRRARGIAKFAFDYATKNGRKKITAVHQEKFMTFSDSLFLDNCIELSTYYPKIKFNTINIDNCTVNLVTNPQDFDVLLTPNLYGDILSSVLAGIVGSPGIVAGVTFSTTNAVFEQGARHLYMRGVNKNIINPTGILLSSAKMLKHINLHPYAGILEAAVIKVLTDGKIKTRDVGGKSHTSDFIKAVIKNADCKD